MGRLAAAAAVVGEGSKGGEPCTEFRGEVRGELCPELYVGDPRGDVLGVPLRDPRGDSRGVW